MVYLGLKECRHVASMLRRDWLKLVGRRDKGSKYAVMWRQCCDAIGWSYIVGGVIAYIQVMLLVKKVTPKALWWLPSHWYVFQLTFPLAIDRWTDICIYKRIRVQSHPHQRLVRLLKMNLLVWDRRPTG